MPFCKGFHSSMRNLRYSMTEGDQAEVVSGRVFFTSFWEFGSTTSVTESGSGMHLSPDNTS